MWLISILDISVRNRRFIILNTLAVTILALIVSLIIPRQYKGITTILPPESQSPLSALGDLSMSQIAMAVTNFTLPVMATPSDLYASMIKSEAVLGEVVDSFDLMSLYNSKYRLDAIEKLSDNVTVTVENEGIITIEALAPSPVLAAEIANALVHLLNELNIEIQKRRGGQHVGFLTERIEKTGVDLQSALNELKAFQERHRAVSLELQSEALIKNLAELKGRHTFEEIELDLMRKTLNPDHPELVKQMRRVEEFRRKLNEIETGAPDMTDSVLSALDIPLAKIPDLSLQFSVLKRNALIQEKLYELLAQQLEMSRIQEQRDTPIISVLDIATPPIRHVKPRRSVIVIVAFMLSAMFSIWFSAVRTGVESRDSKMGAFLERLRQSAREILRRPLG